MEHTKLFNDVTDRRVLDKLIPIDSPHHIQMSQLMIDLISLVPDDDLDLFHSTPESNSADFTGIDCVDVMNQITRQGKTGVWAVTYMLIVFYQAYGAIDVKSNAWR
ncbi:MAG: hypothetical protein ACI9N9_001060, partial [Enterobacterales bacterium]